jgi:hypothetical protein
LDTTPLDCSVGAGELELLASFTGSTSILVGESILIVLEGDDVSTTRWRQDMDFKRQDVASSKKIASQETAGSLRAVTTNSIHVGKICGARNETDCPGIRIYYITSSSRYHTSLFIW